MKAVIKREFKNYLKNPILWIGLVLVCAGIYQMVIPYLETHYFQFDAELEQKKVKRISDGDIMEGYVPSTKEQQLELGYQEIKRQFVEVLGTPENEAEQIIRELREKGMDIEETDRYLAENYNYNGASNSFEDALYHKGNKDEVNAYIKDRVSQHPFSYYFSRKFSDAAGLYMGFFAAVLLAFLFIRDTRKDTYELLHTKPVKARDYIIGKAMGGLLVILAVIAVLTIVFGGLCKFYGGRAGLPVRMWDMVAAPVLYILPNMCMIVSVYAFAALLFKNPLPAAPLIFLYMIYSNMGSTGPDGKYGYYGRPLAIMVRFPGKLFDTSPPPMVWLNQTFLIIASVILLMGAVTLWKRRRVY